MTLTKAQRAALDVIAANGGYACMRAGMHPRWLCGFRGETSYGYRVPILDARTMTALSRAGVLRPAPGHGYGCCSFWEVVPEQELGESKEG